MNKCKRNTRAYLFCLSLIFYGLFILTASAHCGEWIIVGENHVGKFLYDETSISRTENGLVVVDWKVVMSADASKEAADLSPDLKGASLALFHDIINCRERIYETKRIKYYDIKGKLLHDTKTDEAKYEPIGFRPIPPDTLIERLADIVCK